MIAAGQSRWPTSSAMSRQPSVARAGLVGAAPVFAALGDETRLRLVARLCTEGPLSIVRLSAGAAVTRQAVTKHLHALAAAGSRAQQAPRTPAATHLGVGAATA